MLVFGGVPPKISLPDPKTRTVGLLQYWLKVKRQTQTFCFEYEKLISGLYKYLASLL